MTYFPNCREDEDYNQKYLPELDKEFVRGFDWCTELAADNFFDNFDSTGSDYLDVYLNKKVPEYMQKEYEMEWTFGDRKTEKRKVVTYLDYIRYELLSWIESERDMLITSMLDSMSDKEYEKTRSQVDGKTFSFDNKKEEIKMIHKNYLRGIEFNLKQAEIKSESLRNEIELIRDGDITDFFDEHTPTEVIETIVGLKEHELKLIEEYRDTLRAEISTASLKT